MLIKSQIYEVKVAPRWFVYGGVFPIRFCSLAEKSFGYELKKILHAQRSGANVNDDSITSKKNFPSLVSLSNTLQLAGKKTTTQSSLALTG